MSPGEIKIINGQIRICKVVAVVIPGKPGEYETVLRWYLPKTRKDISKARKAQS